VVDVDRAVPVACLDLALPAGFTADQTEVVYWGRCAGCRRT
jgi:hypothetical protein